MVLVEFWGNWGTGNCCSFEMEGQSCFLLLVSGCCLDWFPVVFFDSVNQQGGAADNVVYKVLFFFSELTCVSFGFKYNFNVQSSLFP